MASLWLVSLIKHFFRPSSGLSVVNQVTESCWHREDEEDEGEADLTSLGVLHLTSLGVLHLTSLGVLHLTS